MKTKLLGLIASMALVAVLGLSPAYASNLIYSVAFPVQIHCGRITIVTGTITTDCNSCLLLPSDFVSSVFHLFRVVERYVFIRSRRRCDSPRAA